MIRKANKNDIPAISALLLQVQAVHAEKRPDIFNTGGKKYDESALASVIQDIKNPVFVYEDGNRVVGHIFCVLEHTEKNSSLAERKVLHIDDLCVDEASRGKGIGKALYEYAVLFAKENGVNGITLNVWELNGSARAFYEHLGLVPLKTTLEQRL